MHPDFQLTKWYLDAVSATGEAFIVYWAELRWWRLSGHYAAVVSLENGAPHERASLLPGPAPRLDSDSVSFGCPGLELEGRWSGPFAAAGPQTLLERGGRTLVWECLQPLAEVELRLGERTVRALGYTERVTLSLPPWELPIDELRWGRAHAGGRSVVWVDWTGEPAFHLVLVDGVPRAGGRASDEEVRAEGARLSFSTPRSLRTGPVAGSSLGRVPGLATVLSSAGLLIDEHKWVARASLELDSSTEEGVALYEVVRWR
ncbi:MAG: hypothetical protein JNJ54_15810 [Myxococcaceae bacterium]|nr:hypothetical protein [Myxococcaceae bacterium]